MTDPTPTDWRALCAELSDAMNELSPYLEAQSPVPVVTKAIKVWGKARTALAQPEPQGPTDEELYDYWISTSPEFGCADPVGFARAVLARWSRPAIEPVPQQEAE
jgi:hypothetical protein